VDDLREKRKVLGWSRAELAVRAQVDPRTLQLLELGQSEDTEARERVEAVLDRAIEDRLDA
jgi:transcriptional regulator with XRE-family HTH domain